MSASFREGDMVRLANRTGWWVVVEVYPSGHLRVAQEGTDLFDTVDDEDVTESCGGQR